MLNQYIAQLQFQMFELQLMNPNQLKSNENVFEETMVMLYFLNANTEIISIFNLGNH